MTFEQFANDVSSTMFTFIKLAWQILHKFEFVRVGEEKPEWKNPDSINKSSLFTNHRCLYNL